MNLSEADWVICIALVKYKLRTISKQNRVYIPLLTDISSFNEDELQYCDLRRHLPSELSKNDKQEELINIFNLMWARRKNWEDNLYCCDILLNNRTLLIHLLEDCTHQRLLLHYYGNYRFLLFYLNQQPCTRPTITTEAATISFRCYELIIISYFGLATNYHVTNKGIPNPIKRHLIDGLIFKFIKQELTALITNCPGYLNKSLIIRVQNNMLFLNVCVTSLQKSFIQTVSTIINTMITTRTTVSITNTNVEALMINLVTLLESFVSLLKCHNTKSKTAYARISSETRECKDKRIYAALYKTNFGKYNHSYKLFLKCVDKTVMFLLCLYKKLRFNKKTDQESMSQSTVAIMQQKRKQILAGLLAARKRELLIKYRKIKWL